MLDVPHLLGLLQEDPDHADAMRELRDAVSSGDPARQGPDPLRLVAAARRGHQERGEIRTACQLLELEADLSAGDPDRESALRKELAKLYQDELLDDASAKAAFERALALRPGDTEIQEALEAILAANANWKEIAKRFVDEAENASDATLRTSLLVSAAGFVWKYKKRGRDKDVGRLFAEALEADPSDPRANRLYEHILRSRESWDELAQVLLRAAEKTRGREERVGFYVRAARVFARALSAKERAAACYERVLDIVPGHPEAMRFLVEFFTHGEQWDHLVALYDDALRARQKLESEPGILLQIGMVHWRFRDAPGEAEPYFARLRKIDPAHPGMLAFYREYLPAIGDHGKLLTVLGDAQRVTSDARLKVELAVELARAAHASGASDRAIDAWKAVQRQDPRHPEALRALRELYQQTEKWNALIDVQKGELDALPESAVEARVALLREMIGVYRDHLRLDVMVISGWNAILQLVPNDREALDALAATYEQMGRWNDLIQVLTRKAEAETDPAEQAALYMRVARLWIERFANYNQATRPLEIVVERDPTHREALAQLRDIYTKKRAWKQLFDVQRAEAELASDPSARHAMRIELARVAGERLHRHADAISLWKDVLAHDATNAEALDALEKLAEREKDWTTLASVLERRVADQTDERERIKLLTKLGSLYGEQARDPMAAADAWKRVLAIDPRNNRALRTLREAYVAASDWDGLEALYREQADWDGLAEVLGNAADRATFPEQKVALSLRAADVYEQKIGEPHRAFRSYERVLAVAPTHERAARKLITIYEAEEKWSRLEALYDVVLQSIAETDSAGRIAILERLREVTGEHLNDSQRAFQYQLQAWRLAPTNEAVRAALWSCGERAGAWEALSAAFRTRLEEAPVEERMFLRRSIARIAGERLSDTEGAIAQLREIVEADPTDIEAVTSLHQIYRSSRRFEDLRGLLQSRVVIEQDEAGRSAILHELGKLEVDEFADFESAAKRYRAALAINASDIEALVALDRLATQAARWDELLSVLRVRRDLANSDDERHELLLRTADVLVDRVGDPAAAIDSLASALESRPADQHAIATLERLAMAHPEHAPVAARLLEDAYQAAEEWEKLRELIRRRLESTTDPEEKRSLRLRFAELSVERAEDALSAYRVLESAFLDAPADRDLWERLFGAADRARQHEALAQAIATAIDAGDLAAFDAAQLAEKVAHIYDVVLARPEEAEPFHRRIMAADPSNETSFLALKELYTDSERWDELQVLYRRRIAETVSRDAKLDLLLQVCFLFEELIDDPELAIGAYRDVIELEPEHTASRRALERLYARTERWRDLAELLEEEVERAEGEAAAELTYRLGEIHELRLRAPAAAIERYEATVRLDIDHERARSALERMTADADQRHRAALILEEVYEHRRSYADLARVLEIQLERVNEPEVRVSLLVRVAELQENKLADNSAALRAWSRAVECDPANGSARAELARVAAMLGADRDRAAVLERAIANASEAPGVQCDLLLELALLWDDTIGDVDRSEDAYGRLIEVASDDPEMTLRAARALERIHLGRGEFAKLAVDLRRQSTLETELNARRSLLVRLANLLETQLDDAEGAIAVHSERLELDPSDADALAALERLYESRGRWESLIGILQQQERLSTNDDERMRIALRIASIWDEKLADRGNAITAFQEVVERFGPTEGALLALARLHEQAERWSDLLETVQQLHDLAATPIEKAKLRFRAAELMRERTEEVESAIAAYAEVLEALPGHEGSISALRSLVGSLPSEGAAHSMRLEVARVLCPQFEHQADHIALLGVLEVLATSDDPVERLDALRRATHVAEAGLGDASRAFDYAAQALRAGLGEPDVGTLTADVARLGAASERFLDHVALLRDVTPDIADGELQIANYVAIGHQARHRLRDTELARGYFERVLELQPDHRDALDAVEEMAIEAGDHHALLAVLRRKTELAAGPERGALLMRQAELCEIHVGDHASAIEALEEVLSDDPTHAAAYRGLERLYGLAGRWIDLATLYERMLEHRVGFAVEHHHRLGCLYRTQLDDVARAVDCFRAALGVGAPHEPTIEQLEEIMRDDEVHRALAATILEPIYLTRLSWPRVVEALEARLSAETEQEIRKGLLQRLGQVHEDYLEDLEGGMAVYARLFKEDPRDESTWETLSRLAKVLERWDRLADTYRDFVDEIGVEDEVTQKLATMAAQLYDQKVSDAVKAADLYRRALRFQPEDRETFVALEALYRRISAWDALVTLYEEQAELCPNDQERVELLRKRAAVLRDQKGDPDRAIDGYRAVLEIDPRDVVANVALDELLEGRERWGELAEHLSQRIDLADDTRQLPGLKHRLGMLLADKLDDRSRAIDLFEDVTRDEPRHAPSLAELERLVTDPEHQLRIIQILEPIYQATDQWRKRIAVLEARVALESDPGERVRLLAEVARLHEERGQDLPLAFHALSRALAFEPGNDSIREEVDRLAMALDAWNDLVRTYELAISASTDSVVTSSLLGALARIHDERRGDPRAAIDTYERLVAHDPEDASPLDALEALHTMVGDWVGLCAVLRRKVERSYDPLERAELLRRAGSVMEDLLGDRDRAIQLYKEASAEDVSDVVALESLDRLLSESGDHAALAEVLKRRVELDTDPEVRADLGLRLGQLAEDELREPDAAIQAMVQVLVDRPNDVSALVALSRLYERQSMWSELLDNLRLRAATTGDAEERIALMYRAAGVLERELDDAGEALETYRHVLDLDSSHEATIVALMRIAQREDHRLGAIEMVAPLLRTHRRFDDLARMIELSAESMNDPIDKRNALRSLAEVHEQGRLDSNAAFESYRAALTHDASDLGIADELERLAGTLDAWDRVADVFAARASSIMEPELARGFYERLARISELRLGDDARAIEAYRRAIEQVGDDEALLGNLDRLYTKTQAFTELVDVLERMSNYANDPASRIELLVRLGSLRLEHRIDRNAALASLQEVLESQPGEARSIALLEGLLVDDELAPQAVEVLEGAYRLAALGAKMAALFEVKVRLAGNDSERVALLTELAQLREQEVGDPAAALSTLIRAFEIDRRDESILDEIERLAMIVDGWEALRGLIERVGESSELDGTSRRDLELRAARWYRDRMGDRESAEAALRRAIGADRESSSAHSELVELLGIEGRESDLVDALSAWAAVEYDEFEKKERLRRAARVSERSLSDVARATQFYWEILEVDGGDIGALDELIRLRTADGSWSDVASLLEKRIDIEADLDRRIELRRALASAFSGPLAKPTEAIQAWCAVLDELPTDLDAMNQLERLYESGEQWSDLEELFQRRLDLAETPADRIAVRVRLARLSETRFGRRSEAIEQLHEILEEDSQNREALDELERLYGVDDRLDDLVALLERRSRDAAGLGDIEQSVTTTMRLAEAHEKKGDSESALDVYGKLLEQSSEHEDALRASIRLHLAAGRAADALPISERLMGILRLPEARDEAFRVAELAASLGEPDRAERALRRVHELDPIDGEIRAKLKSHYDRHERWAELAEMLAIDADSISDPAEKIAILRRIADLHGNRLGDAAMAATFLERAVALDPENRDVLLPLCDLYVAAGRQDDAVPVLEKIIASYGSRRSKEVAVFQHRLGRALEGKGDTSGALQAYDAAFKVDLTNVHILRDLGRLCYAEGDYDRAQKTFRALLLQKLDSSAGISKGDVYFYLGDISVKQGDTKKAMSMLERALAEEAGHAKATELLSSLKS